MEFENSEKPKDLNAYGVLGYVVVANKQIHNY